MSRLLITSALFAALCFAMYLVSTARGGDETPAAAETAKDPALSEIESILKIAESAEHALGNSDFGTAKAKLGVITERLNKLAFIVAHEKIRDAHETKQ